MLARSTKERFTYCNANAIHTGFSLLRKFIKVEVENTGTTQVRQLVVSNQQNFKIVPMSDHNLHNI